MSITLKQAPPQYSPVYNEMVFVADSTNKTQPGFKYVFSIFDKDLNLLARVKRFPEPVAGYGFYDIHRILENYVSFDLDDTLLGARFYENKNSFIEYKIYIGEEYGTTTNLIAYISGSLYAYNGVFDYPDFVKYNQDNWLLPVTGGRLLTNAPDTQYIRLDTNAFLYFISDGPDDTSRFLLTVNALNGDTSDYLLDRVPASNGARFLRLPSGPKNLNSSTDIELGFGGIDNTIASYTLQAMNTSGDLIGNAVTYIIDYSCSKYDIYRLHFLNRLGGFDSMDFKLVSTEEVAIQRNTYDKRLGGLSGSSYVYLARDRGKVQFATLANKNMMLTSDWFDDARSRWLEELATSPEVYMEAEDGSFIPVNLTDEKYTIGKKQNTKLINLQLNLTFSYNKYRQRG